MVAIHRQLGVRDVERDSSFNPYWSVTDYEDMDRAFCTAMERAIKRGKERPFVGIITTPCTEYPIFVPTKFYVGSYCGSQGQLCAESGVQSEESPGDMAYA